MKIANSQTLQNAANGEAVLEVGGVVMEITSTSEGARQKIVVHDDWNKPVIISIRTDAMFLDDDALTKRLRMHGPGMKVGAFNPGKPDGFNFVIVDTPVDQSITDSAQVVTPAPVAAAPAPVAEKPAAGPAPHAAQLAGRLTPEGPRHESGLAIYPALHDLARLHTICALAAQNAAAEFGVSRNPELATGVATTLFIEVNKQGIASKVLNYAKQAQAEAQPEAFTAPSAPATAPAAPKAPAAPAAPAKKAAPAATPAPAKKTAEAPKIASIAELKDRLKSILEKDVPLTPEHITGLDAAVKGLAASKGTTDGFSQLYDVVAEFLAGKYSTELVAATHDWLQKNDLAALKGESFYKAIVTAIPPFEDKIRETQKRMAQEAEAASDAP
jgi:hypothetical protein